MSIFSNTTPSDPLGLNQTETEALLVSIGGQIAEGGEDIGYALRLLGDGYYCAMISRHGSISAAAKALGIHRNTLARKLKEK